MNSQYLVIIVGFVFSLTAAFAWLAWQVRRQSRTFSPRFNPSLTAAGLTCFAALLPALWALWRGLNHDFIRDAAPFSFALPLLLIILVAAVYFMTQDFRLRLAAAAAAVFLSLFLLPDFYILFDAGLPLWLNRFFTGLLWLAAAYSLRLLSRIDGLAPQQIAFMALGAVIIGFTGGAPMLLAYSGAVLFAAGLALLLYNRYPARLILNPPALDLLGLLAGWLLVSLSVEDSGASALILSLYLLLEALWSLLQRATFLPAYRDLYANTVAAQADASGLKPGAIVSHVIRLNIVLLLFAAFQVYAPNGYSLPLFAAVIAGWNLYRLYHWQQPNKKLGEINREVAAEFKQNIQKIRDNLNRKE